MTKIEQRYAYTSKDGLVTVILHEAYFMCTGCKVLKPAEDVGLRKMNDGIIRNQPHCKECRAPKGTP